MHDAPEPQSSILSASTLAGRPNHHDPESKFPQWIELEEFGRVNRNPLKKLDMVIAALQRNDV